MTNQTTSTTPLALIDIGINLTNKAFTNQEANIVNKAHAAGISKLIITGTNLAESQQAAELAASLTASTPATLFSTAGVHPHDASEWSDAHKTAILALAQKPHVVAIGECGLDYNRNYSTPDEQRSAFIAQIEIAIETQLPMFLHERDAFDDMHAILNEYRAPLKNVVIHCFTGNPEQAQAYIDVDCHLGITGWVCDERRGQDLQAAVKTIPSERLMLETDAPYLLPRTSRPKPKSRHNLPEYLPEVAQAVAELRSENIAIVAQESTTVTQHFFGI